MKEIEINNALRLLGECGHVYVCVREVYGKPLSILRVYVPIHFSPRLHNTKELSKRTNRGIYTVPEEWKGRHTLGRYTLKCIISSHISI